ncbi:MAG: ParB N-terminal domain-containing protein [Candidatus Woesearchaeota archaeon]
MKITTLLENQFKKKEFNRVDIIVRYLFIEKYFGKKFDIDVINLYIKMQKNRLGIKKYNQKDYIKNFEELIISFKKNNYDLNKPIILTGLNELFDGSHRIAAAIFFKIDDIPCQYVENKKVKSYSLNWFKNQVNKENNKLFTKKEIKLIKEYLEKIILKKIKNKEINNEIKQLTKEKEELINKNKKEKEELININKKEKEKLTRENKILNNKINIQNKYINSILNSESYKLGNKIIKPLSKLKKKLERNKK